MAYVGRFAPSPTGPLHLGSLVTAVGSYLHARQAGGEWLVRIEDIDPPREAPGAADRILHTLEAFELDWDRTVERQSRRLKAYLAAAQRLLEAGLAFRCRCSRSTLRALHDSRPGRYPGTCRTAGLTGPDAAVRALVADDTEVAFEDGLQGTITTRLAETLGDYVIFRRDGLPAYHLAVVLDDAEAGVTTVVRGVDLLESTAAHVHLQHMLGLSTPRYFHLPVLVNEAGQKLSKQTGAAPVTTPTDGVAATVLDLLGLQVPAEMRRERPSALWRWAGERWRIETLKGRRSIVAP